MSQRGLFDLPAGEAEKKRGQDLVEVNSGEFAPMMREYARDFAARTGTVTADDLRLEAVRRGIKPHHHNVWGAIFRGREFEQVGWAKSALVTNHAHQNRVWRLRT